MKSFEILSLLIGIVTVFALYWQVNLARQAFELGKLREKKSATISFFEHTREITRERHANVRNKLGIDKSKIMTTEKARKIYNDGDEKIDVMHILSALERLGVGIYHDVYDFFVIKDLARTNIMSMWSFYYNYIMIARESTPNSYFYFEKLVERLYDSAVEEGAPLSNRYKTYLSQNNLAN